MTSTESAEYQLEARYRRILSFGDVLDESIGLFRRRWAFFAQISAIWLIPPGVFLTLLVARSSVFNSASLVDQLASGAEPDLSTLSGLASLVVLSYVVSGLFYLAWATSVLLATDAYVHGVEPSLKSVLARTLRRLFPALRGGIYFGAAIMMLVVVATLIFALYIVAFPVSLLAILAAIAGGVIWAFQPRARSVWLKWLIVIATPFGLPIYAAGACSMYLSLIVLERQHPFRALRRSVQLVDRHWFRVVGILVLASLVVGIVQSVPTSLVQLPLTISAALRGQVGLSGPELAASNAVGILSQILFASMGSIVYAMVFVDLRNRREATDLAERLSRLEASSAIPTPVVDG